MEELLSGQHGADIAEHVFSFLGVSDKQTVAQVCRLWRDIVYLPSLWKEVTVVVPLKCSEVLVKSLEKRKIRRLYCPRATDEDLSLLFSHLTEISHVDLEGCPKVSETFLKRELPKLEHLEHLGFRRSACINDSILEVCGPSLKKIKSLSLENCHEITQNGFNNLIKHLDNLESLALTKCYDLGDEWCLHTVAKSCPKLTRLSLCGCDWVTAESLQHMVKNPLHITHLDLECTNSNVNDLSLELIAKHLPNLTFLDLTDCLSITSKGISCIARNLPKLRHLMFDGSEPCEPGDEPPFFASSYRDLELMFCEIAKLSELRSLMLFNGITNSSIQTLVKNLPNLTSLSVGHNNSISDKTCELIGTHLQRLEYLLLSSRKMSEKGFTVLTSKLKKLMSLNLEYCGNITDKCMERMAPNLLHLESFTLSKLTDVGVKHLAMNLKGLTKLVLRDSRKLTNVGVTILAVNLPQLLQLDLSHCCGVSNEGVLSNN